MADLLTLLRDEAVSLAEHALPSPEETRAILGALVNRVGRFEEHVLGELKPAPEPPAAEPAAPAAEAPADPAAELAAAKARVAELEANAAAPPPGTATVTGPTA